MSQRTFALVLTGVALLLMAACGSYTTDEMAARDPDTGYFVVGCGLFDPYNENMTRRTMDGRFPGGGGGGATAVGTFELGGDTDCGQW